MTPLAFVLVRRLRLPATLFAFACTLVASGASIPLPISNPINFSVDGAQSSASQPPYLAQTQRSAAVRYTLDSGGAFGFEHIFVGASPAR